MSRFATALKVAVEDARLTQAQVSAMSGVPQSQLSKYLSDSIEASPESLDKLLSVFARPARDRIVIAYLQDRMPDSAREIIRVESIGDASLTREDHPAIEPEVRLPREMREMFARLQRRAAEDGDLSEALLAIDRLFNR